MPMLSFPSAMRPSEAASSTMIAPVAGRRSQGLCWSAALVGAAGALTFCAGGREEQRQQP
jgi:hypothetical protein